MTAVDHAELKRLVSRLRAIAGDYIGRVDRASCIETEAADGLDALLSEIEGLKADGEVYQQQADHEFAKRKEAERQLASLRTQARDSWRPDREACVSIDVARMESCLNDLRPANNAHTGAATAYNYLLSMTRLAALLPQTAESGK